MPTWQVNVYDGRGFVGRVDGLWARGVVGESDGKAKYLLRAAELGGVDAKRLAQMLHEEREREMRLRATGLSVVRWGPKDVLGRRAAAALAEHLRAELAAAEGKRWTATARPHPIPLPH